MKPFEKLNKAQQSDVLEFMRDNPNIHGGDPLKLSAWECISAWLQWNGINQYTDQIISLVCSQDKKDIRGA
jgi:hypothetical protein